jgi:hypothetical protein
MPLNLRHTMVAASVSGVLLLATACSSTNGSTPTISTAPAAPAAPAPAVAVSVNGSATVTLGSTSQYAATVSGSINQTVSWTVNQVAGGNAQLGTISTTGLYTAPATMPPSSRLSIAATSVADPTISSTISVTLQAPVPSPVGPSAPRATATAAARFLDQTSFGPRASINL